MKEDLHDMLADLFPLQNVYWRTFEVYADECLSILPSSGVTVEQLEQAAAPLAAARAWHVSSTNGNQLRIEPNVTEPARLDRSPWLFHASLLTNRSGIQTRGIEPRGGQTTSASRTYPPRVHLAVSLQAAIQFIEHEVANRNGAATTSLDEWDIWRSEKGHVRQYRVDPRFKGEGVWTPSAIPKSKIARVRCWRLHGRIHRVLRSAGVL